MHLKPDTEDEQFGEFWQEYRLRQLVKKYSDYIRWPIKMLCHKTRPVEKPEGEEADDQAPAYESYEEDETLNSMVPIWHKPKGEVSEEDYANFYKEKFGDYQDPLKSIRVSAEGLTASYEALLFIPARTPYNYYSADYEKGLQLYSSGVLIMEKCADLLPEHFRFVQGVVDSQDISLNISREMLQQDRQVRTIAQSLEKKIKADLANMRDDDRTAYEKFFEQFGRTLKFGIYQSYGMAKDTLGDLLFYSAKEQKMITLDEYLAAAPPGADSIFYAAGDSLERLAAMPLVTTVLAKGYDVLLCDQDVDEFCMMAMGTYGEHAVDGDEENKQPYFIKNVGSEDLGLTTDEEKKEAEEATESNAELFDVMREALGERWSALSFPLALPMRRPWSRARAACRWPWCRC